MAKCWTNNLAVWSHYTQEHVKSYEAFAGFQISFNPFHRSVVVTASSDGFIRSTNLESEQTVDVIYKWYNHWTKFSDRKIGCHKFVSANELIFSETDPTTELVMHFRFCLRPTDEQKK